MKLRVALPIVDIGGGPEALRELSKPPKRSAIRELLRPITCSASMSPAGRDGPRGEPDRPTGITYGGHADVTLRRCAKWGDGWMPLAYAPGEEARAAFDRLRAHAEAEGRDPATIGIDTRFSPGAAPRRNGATRCEPEKPSVSLISPWPIITRAVICTALPAAR